MGIEFGMKTSDFDYQLPSDRIAQVPVEPRDHSRLLVLRRASGEIAHRRFWEIESYLNAGDVLVLNESRVIPARLLGEKKAGGARIELLLLNRLGPNLWEALARPGKRLRCGSVIEVTFADKRDRLIAEIQEKREDGTVRVRLSEENLIERLGTIPLPPYIHNSVVDPERYQTVYARIKGSVAAPTAGLHFTPDLLDRIRRKGVETVRVTLHVGLGSFRPVKTEDPAQHVLHTEYCEVSPEAARKLILAKRERRRIVAVGTTAVRAIERAAQSNAEIKPFRGWNDLYILPGYQFQIVDALVTNFHLPRSTLLMLVCAFAGRELTLDAYQEAIREGYRFYSFGDAMLIL